MKRGKVWSLLLMSATSFLASCQSDRHLYPGTPHAHVENHARSLWRAQEGYEHLLKTKIFAFGRIGYWGQTSDGEFAFRAVLKSPKAAELFKDIYLRATDEGKLYALCGLGRLDPNAFDHYAEILRSKESQVLSMSGDVGTYEPVGAVIQRIKDGIYDSYFAKR
jgi:hypothetical protein